MSADEVYLWLLPVMALGAFLLGGYLLLSDRQAKAAGADSNKIKFLGVEIESSTSGTTLIILAIVVVVVVISLGVGRAADDGDDDTAGDDETSESTSNSTGPDDQDTDTSGPPADNNPSGLERSDLISVHDLENATSTHGFTDWQDIDPVDRPVLDCQQRSMPELPDFVRKPIKDNFEGDAEFGYPADAMTSAARFSTGAAAESAYRQVTTWLGNCPGGLPGATSLDVNRAGSLEVDGDVSWRNFWDGSDQSQCASSCVWIDSQGVALVDDAVLLISVRWFTEADPATVRGPMPDLLPVVVDQLD